DDDHAHRQGRQVDRRPGHRQPRQGRRLHPATRPARALRHRRPKSGRSARDPGRPALTGVRAENAGARMPELYLKQMELGPMQNYVYLVGHRTAGGGVVVDPAWEINAIVDAAEADGMRITGALVTHAHPDHVGGALFGMDIPGVSDLLERAPARVYASKAECPFLPGFGSDLVPVEAGA